MNNNGAIKLLGFLFIFIGLGYLGDQLGFWTFTLFFNGWWAIGLLLLGIYSIIKDKVNLFNTLTCFIGVYCFLYTNGVIHFEITLGMLVSIGLILYGIKLLLNKEQSKNVFVKENNESVSVDNESINTENTGNKRVYIHNAFNTRTIVEEGIIDKCRIESHFGTTYVDLSNTDLRTLDLLSVECLFGSVKIILPIDANVSINNSKISSSSYVDMSTKEDGYSIIVREFCIFGDVKIIKQSV